jgi:hypothetical protein
LDDVLKSLKKQGFQIDCLFLFLSIEK